MYDAIIYEATYIWPHINYKMAVCGHITAGSSPLLYIIQSQKFFFNLECISHISNTDALLLFSLDVLCTVYYNAKVNRLIIDFLYNFSQNHVTHYHFEWDEMCNCAFLQAMNEDQQCLLPKIKKLIKVSIVGVSSLVCQSLSS